MRTRRGFRSGREKIGGRRGQTSSPPPPPPRTRGLMPRHARTTYRIFRTTAVRRGGAGPDEAPVAEAGGKMSWKTGRNGEDLRRGSKQSRSVLALVGAASGLRTRRVAVHEDLLNRSGGERRSRSAPYPGRRPILCRDRRRADSHRRSFLAAAKGVSIGSHLTQARRGRLACGWEGFIMQRLQATGASCTPAASAGANRGTRATVLLGTIPGRIVAFKK